MIKIFLKGSLLLTCLASAIISKAQHSDSTVTIIFAGDKSKISKTSKTKKIDPNNIIKVAPTGVFVGQIPLIYERKLTPNISIQVGAGLTNQNYIRTMFMKASENSIATDYPWANSPTAGSDESEGLYSFNTRKAEMGTMFTIQPKFYLDDDALDGSYVGFSYNLYNYKFSTLGANYNNLTGLHFNGSSQSESEKVTDFMLHYGKQSINGHFSLEYSTAIGLRKVEGSKYGATTDAGQSKGYSDGFINYKQTLFNYEFAIRVGYVF